MYSPIITLPFGDGMNGNESHPRLPSHDWNELTDQGMAYCITVGHENMAVSMSLLLCEILNDFANFCTVVKLLSHIDALADAQGTNMVVRHTAKYVSCKFISRSLIGTIRSCA